MRRAASNTFPSDRPPMLKFIHAADIHLDSPLRGLDQYDGCPAETIRGAARRAFENLIQLAIAEKVDFILLAGDIYDGDWPDYTTGLFFIEQLKKLKAKNIPVVLLYGNHDAQSRITKQLTLPDNTQVLNVDSPQTLKLGKLPVAIHGQGFAHQAEDRNIALVYPPAVPGHFNIGMLHTSLDGREGHATYAPCSKAELMTHGYQYWALGHIHQRESVNGDGKLRIEFPGNVQGRHIRETGAKGCLLVEVDAKLNAMPEFRALDVFRWADLAISAADAETLDDVLAEAGSAILEAKANAGRRALAVRLNITCPATLCAKLADDLDKLRAELTAQLPDEVWLEKVKLRPTAAPDAVQDLGDAGTVVQAVLDGITADRAHFDGDCGKMIGTLPAELRGPFTMKSDEDMQKQFEELFQEIRERAALLLGAGSRTEGSP